VILFIVITLPGAAPRHLRAQQVITEAPPLQAAAQGIPAQSLPGESLPAAVSLPDSPDVALQDQQAELPRAVELPSSPATELVIETDTDGSQEKHGDLYTATGHVVITYRDRTLRADRATYDAATGDIHLDGDVEVTGGVNDEYLRASHGTLNVRTETGSFYDVNGSTGVHESSSGTTYSNANPFLFTGRMVVKTGPASYVIYNGSVTSCLLPHPDWQLFAGRFVLDGKEAKAKNSIFRLLNVPVLYLPYVTHPTDPDQRQAGLMIPVLGETSTKGFILGEEFFLPLGRSADMLLGVQYYSMRGWEESGTFRYRGRGDDFLLAHFSALQDRGYTPEGGVYTNQGGQDVSATFRRRLTVNTRAVADVEYLSSYVYREAFTESFNQAVSSDITSIGYVVRQNDGYSLDGRAERYQGLKRVPVQTATGFTAGQEVHILHVPALDFTADDHRIAGTPLLWRVDASITGLKRVQPNFVTGGVVARLDLRPEIALPLSGGGWHAMISAAVRETAYSRSRLANDNLTPTEVTQPVNRASAEIAVDVRPPAIERDFTPPSWLARWLGPELRHVVEPELTYRYTGGIGNFKQLLRFDDTDVDSDTNELEYGVTQRLFARTPAAKPVKLKPGEVLCPVDDAGADAPVSTGVDANGIPVPAAPDAPLRTHPHRSHCKPQPPTQREFFSWRLAQTHYFDPYFGGAVINGRRNIFETTLALSGVAFLTEPRSISPLISRLRLRASDHFDVAWDFDLDTGAKRFTSSNVYLDAHAGRVFGGVSYARLNAPGRFYTVIIDNNDQQQLQGSSISDFSQARFLLGYGKPSQAGLSLAANAGVDFNLGSVQYAALQANYNWNCCGVAIEYRKYELGSVRNENAYKFNFTLANIGTAGNLRRQERLF
jgi:LPS-assembly protein